MLNKSAKKKQEADKVRAGTKRKLTIVFFMSLTFCIIEVIGGYMAESIAIMSDAAHMVSDLIGYAGTLYAIYLSSKAADASYGFGYHRAEILGALF